MLIVFMTIDASPLFVLGLCSTENDKGLPAAYLRSRKWPLLLLTVFLVDLPIALGLYYVWWLILNPIVQPLALLGFELASAFGWLGKSPHGAPHDHLVDLEQAPGESEPLLESNFRV